MRTVQRRAPASKLVKARDFEEDIPRNADRGVLGWDGLLEETQSNVSWLASDETKFSDNDDDIGNGGGILGVVQTSVSAERGSDPQEADVDVFGVDDGYGLGDSCRVFSLSEILLDRDYSHVCGNDNAADFNPFLNPVKIDAALDVATDGDDDYMRPEGCNFSVGDFVWCNAESRPWWPGRIYDPDDASDYAATLRLKNHYLVAYFGGGTFAWCHPCQLKPFEENFQKMVKQSNSKAFINAIKETLGEIVQVLEFKMASSVAREGQNKPCRSLAKNYGIKEGVFIPEIGTNNLANVLCKPAKLLARVKLAKIGRIANVLQLEIMKVHLSAFYYYKGGYSLPTYKEPTRLTAHVDPSDDATKETNDREIKLVIQGQCEEPGVPKFDETTETMLRKCPGPSNGRIRTYPRRKQKSIAELLKDGRSADANTMSVPVEQVLDIWEMPQSSIDKRNSQEEATDCFYGGITESSERRQTEISGSNSSDPTNQIAGMECTGVDKATDNGAWLGAERSEVKVEHEVDDGGENKTDEPVLSTNRAVKGFSLPSKKQTLTGPLSRERKKSKYLCYPYVSPVTIEDCGVDDHANQLADIEGTGNNIATNDGAWLGAETSRVKIETEDDASEENTSEEAALSTRYVRSFTMQEEQNQKEPLSRERKKSKYLCYPFVSPNTIDACGVDVANESLQLEQNAMDAAQLISSPRLSDASRPDLSTVASFCKEEDNSTLQTPVQYQNKVVDRKKMKAASSCEILSEILSAAVNTPFDKEFTFSDVAMYFMYTFRRSAFLDGSLYAAYHECKLGKKRKNGASEFGSSWKDQNQNGEIISMHEPQKKRRANLDVKKHKSSSVSKRRGKGKKKKKKATSPATLFLTFGPGSSSPSKVDLINIYGKFGPLNETETMMFCDNFCARVSFLRRSDAAEALRYSRSTILFGSTKVNYYLHYPSEANNSGERTRKPKAKSSLPEIQHKIPNNVSVDETTNSHSLKLLRIRQNLLMMNSMLKASGGEVSPRTTTRLENDIEALLKKVNTLVDPSTS